MCELVEAQAELTGDDFRIDDAVNERRVATFFDIPPRERDQQSRETRDWPAAATRDQAGSAEVEFACYGGIVAGDRSGIVRIDTVRGIEGKAPYARLDDCLRAAGMCGQKPQADNVAGKCELDDITAPVPADREQQTIPRSIRKRSVLASPASKSI